MRCPEDPDILKALGDLHTATGRFEEGLEIDRKLITVCPEDPDVWYNYACSCALHALADEAVSALEKAVRLGYDNYQWMLQDSDLESLRSDERFKRLVSVNFR